MSFLELASYTSFQFTSERGQNYTWRDDKYAREKAYVQKKAAKKREAQKDRRHWP